MGQQKKEISMQFSKLIAIPICLGLFSTSVFAAAPVPAKPPLTTVNENKDKEKLLGDSIGKTLYVFDKDLKEIAPVCVGECAELWPPYLLTADEVSSLQLPLGSIKRMNDQMQLTYNGRPVYTYAFDRLQGDELGEGIGGVWHYIEVP